MHSALVKQRALALIAGGVNDCEVARQLGIARTTVRDWRAPRYVSKRTATCPRCWRPVHDLRFTSSDYALLLGLYLGDGHIVRMARTFRLRIFMDGRYHDMITAARDVVATVLATDRVHRVTMYDGSMVVVSAYSTHLPCLFPQHGPGKKHERRIALESWQEAHVDAAPWAFLQGCIWSDGCHFVNRTGPYEYLSYSFDNYSRDVLDLFSSTCDRVGVEHRRYEKSIRIYRRMAVAAMVEHVGFKS